MTPLRDDRGLCSVCGRREGHRDWCERIAEFLDEQNPTYPETCTYGDCSLPHFAKFLCSLHYRRQLEGRDIETGRSAA